MKIIVLLAVISFTAASQFYAWPKLDMDNMVKNVTELKQFTSCLLDKTPCSAVHEDYRVRAWEVIHELCRRCSPYDKHAALQYFNAMKTLLPDEYVELKKKYDPENKYFDKLEAEIANLEVE